MDHRGKGLQKVGFSSGGRRDEFDRCLLHCSFPRRVPEQQLADSPWCKFLSICGIGFRVIFSRRGDPVPLLAHSAVDVPTEAIPQGLTGEIGIALAFRLREEYEGANKNRAFAPLFRRGRSHLPVRHQLKVEAQSELNHARAVRRVKDPAEGVTVGNVGIRIAATDPVKHVEHIRAELQRGSLC